MKTTVVSREELKDAVNQALALPTVKSGDLFIAGVTKAKNYNGQHQMILEIVQSKKNQSRKVNLVALANLGDSRFKPSARALRVWVKITPEGFDYLFHSLTVRPGNELTGAELQEKTASLQNKEILAVFTKIKSIMVEGEEEIPTISVKQYSLEAGLPKRISDILNTEEDERTEAQVADLESMTMVTTEDKEALVDEFGNQVYEINAFTYGEDEDIYIPKMTISAFEAKEAKPRVVAPKSNILADLIE